MEGPWPNPGIRNLLLYHGRGWNVRDLRSGPSMEGRPPFHGLSIRPQKLQTPVKRRVPFFHPPSRIPDASESTGPFFLS
jgi:hypothetical protein